MQKLHNKSTQLCWKCCFLFHGSAFLYNFNLARRQTGIPRQNTSRSTPADCWNYANIFAPFSLAVTKNNIESNNNKGEILYWCAHQRQVAIMSNVARDSHPILHKHNRHPTLPEFNINNNSGNGRRKAR